jgi:23S rRNA pseudouridine1911/1915/1917 synthase
MNREKEWTVEPNFSGERLDKAINIKFGLSRNQAQTMLESGDVKIEERQLKPNHRLKGGEKILLRFPEENKPVNIIATRLEFPILFEDDDIVVIDKPAGVVVHPGAGKETETVVSALLGHTRLSPIGAPLRPGVVHRLDKGTSGVMVLAKNSKAHRALTETFAGHDIHKEYLAIIQGHIVNKKGRIEVTIERDRVHRKRMKATSPEKGRMALSRFEVVEYLEGATLVRVQIMTGRTHQIRVHMSFTGHPLVGDRTYGGRAVKGINEIFLHSARLIINHPITGKQNEFAAVLPPAFISALETLGMKRDLISRIQLQPFSADT